MEQITVTVDRNMLMQLIDTVRAAANDMEMELDTLDAEYAENVTKDVAWFRQCADHVETAVSNV